MSRVRCPKCRMLRPRNSFPPRPAFAEGTDWYCAECRRDQREWVVVRRLAAAEAKKKERLRKAQQKRSRDASNVRIGRITAIARSRMPCRVLMADGTWQVPPSERPARFR